MEMVTSLPGAPEAVARTCVRHREPLSIFTRDVGRRRMACMFDVRAEHVGSGNFVGRAVDEERSIDYATDDFANPDLAAQAARDWVAWFEGVPFGRAESIYYILAVPETWPGPPAEGARLFRPSFQDRSSKRRAHAAPESSHRHVRSSRRACARAGVSVDRERTT